jgi:hypothetical protein
VRESRLPEFRTRDLYTKAGLIELSFKEHPGLRIGNFFNLNAKIAYDMMYRIAKMMGWRVKRAAGRLLGADSKCATGCAPPPGRRQGLSGGFPPGLTWDNARYDLFRTLRFDRDGLAPRDDK